MCLLKMGERTDLCFLSLSQLPQPGVFLIFQPTIPTNTTWKKREGPKNCQKFERGAGTWISCPNFSQLMVNCWFGLVGGLVFESGYTQESQSLSISKKRKKTGNKKKELFAWLHRCIIILNFRFGVGG